MMVYIITEFRDSSLSQSEVKVGGDWFCHPLHPKTSSKKPTQDRVNMFRITPVKIGR